MLKSRRRQDGEPLLSDVLNGIYRNDEDFITADEQARRSNGNHRMPAYKSAILRVCQLQLKICSKLIELATPSSSSSPPAAPTTAVSRCSTIKPSTLKRLAGRSVLGHSGRCPNGLARILRPKAQFNDDDGLFYYQVLPNELIKFLQDGATDCD